MACKILPDLALANHPALAHEICFSHTGLRSGLLITQAPPHLSSLHILTPLMGILVFHFVKWLTPHFRPPISLPCESESEVVP